jgi:queuine tRNA-ribosyltransferase
VRLQSPTSTARRASWARDLDGVQAALGSDIALVFDECTPFNVSREYTARSTERTHRWLDRCLAWHAQHGPEGQAVYGIVQGGVHEDLRRWSAQEVAARRHVRHRDRRLARAGQAADVRGGRVGRCRSCRRSARATCWASATSTTSCAASSSGMDTFDCAMPTRIGRHGHGGRPGSRAALARRPRQGALEARRRAAARGLPVPGVRAGYSRGYLHYLLRIGETTARG